MNPCVKGIDEDSRILAVSKCLEDALEAALRNALELALKIAMTEVSRLTDQALRDVSDQIHESQQENITLKLRLQHIHAEHYNPKLTNQSRIKSAGSVRETQESDGVNGANTNKEDTSDPEKKFKTDHTQHTDNIQHVDPSDQDPSSSELVFEQVKVENEKPEPEDQGPSIDTSEISWSSSGCVSSFSTPFDGLNQSVDKTSLTQSTQNCREGRTVQSSLYVCQFCGFAFHSESDQRNHLMQYHKTVLKGKGVNATRMKKQKQQRFPPGCSPFHCTVCNQRFKRLENLKTHLRIHTGERPYPCSVCGVRFRHAGVLKRHFRIHTGEKPYICSECGKSFRNCGGLRFHQKSHSPVNSLRK